MSFETMSAIAKCLHPDASPSEEERTSAFKLFSAWRAELAAHRGQGEAAMTRAIYTDTGKREEKHRCH